MICYFDCKILCFVFQIIYVITKKSHSRFIYTFIVYYCIPYEPGHTPVGFKCKVFS